MCSLDCDQMNVLWLNDLSTDDSIEDVDDEEDYVYMCPRCLLKKLIRDVANNEETQYIMMRVLDMITESSGQAKETLKWYSPDEPETATGYRLLTLWAKKVELLIQYP